MARLPVLKEKIRSIPSSPGVYFFFGKNGKPLYIGKAVNLKNRINQYFTGKTYSPFLKYLLDEVQAIDFEVKDSEIEALIVESQYIKKYKPKYNQKLRDDKQYFYVVFTKEKFPRIFITHRPNAEIAKALSRTWPRRPVKSKYLGPFTDGAVLKLTLRFLRRTFPYCTCKRKHNNFCLNYHIGKCLGFCCLKDNAELSRSTAKNLKNYKKNIKALKDILTGKRESLIKKLEKEMNRLGKEERFEEAIELKGQIERLNRVFENAKIIRYFDDSKYFERSKYRKKNTIEELKIIFKLPGVPKRIEGYDISNIQGTNATGSMVVFTNGQPDKNEYRKFKIRTKTTPDDIAMLKEVLTRRFNHPEWQYPDLILIDGGKAQLNTAHKILKHLNLEIPVVSLVKGRGERVLFNKKLTSAPNHPAKAEATGQTSGRPIVQLPPEVQNLIKYIDAEAHRFAIRYYRQLHRSQLK